MGKKSKGIPDRWLDFLPVGLVITGTKIVAFKVPLNTDLCQRHLPEKEWFTPAMLLDRQPKLKTIIDLTNTFRYYNGEEEFSPKGIDHVKILVEGRGTIPTVLQLQKFFGAIDNHMEKYKDNGDALIGVHCTHGLNRTGYFVCRWMLERMDITSDDVIERFNVARGHKIERQQLLDDLRRKDLPSVPRFIRSLPPPPRSNDYRSPLDDCSYDEPSRDHRYGRYGDKDTGRRRNGYSRREHSFQNEGTSGRYRGDRTISDSGRSDRDRSRGYFRNTNFEGRDNNDDKWRRFGGDGRSRVDLDTNWRARGAQESIRGENERSFRSFGGSRSWKKQNEK